MESIRFEIGAKYGGILVECTPSITTATGGGTQILVLLSDTLDSSSKMPVPVPSDILCPKSLAKTFPPLSSDPIVLHRIMIFFFPLPPSYVGGQSFNTWPTS